jgi:glycosyltransferase involved in cell wall biosynthesis
MKISVVIPCFNGEEFIADAVGSVLAQTHADLECIVVDDASTDNSRRVLSQLASQDQRVRPLFLDRNSGAATARNRGIETATGEWIAFLDADDLYEPDRLERLLELARTTDSVMVVDNQSIRKFPDGAHRFAAFRFLRGDKPIQITQELYFQEEAYIGPHLRSGYMKIMIARSWLQEVNVRFNPKFRSGQDCFFYGELFAHRPRCFGTNYMGYIYRRRDGSLSRSGPEGLRFRGLISSDLIERHGTRFSPASIASLARRKRDLDRYAALHDIRFALRDFDLRRAFSAVQAQPDFGVAFIHVLRRRLGLALAQ